MQKSGNKTTHPPQIIYAIRIEFDNVLYEVTF